MKKIFSVLLVCSVCTASLFAQRTTLVNRNGDEKFGYNVTTADATPKYIDSFAFKNNEGGMLETSVIGYAKDTALVVTGKIFVRFNVHRGTLTMGSVTADQAIVTDSGISGATFTYVAANGKIYLQVTGKAATNITWTSISKRKSVWYLN